MSVAPAAHAPATSDQGPAFAPVCDIADLGKEYVLTADVPGVSADGIAVTFEDGVLSLQASPAARGPQHGAPVWREYGVGDVRRQFRVGEDVNVEGITASCKDGVLTVHLPKAGAATARKVAIKAG